MLFWCYFGLTFTAGTTQKKRSTKRRGKQASQKSSQTLLAGRLDSLERVVETQKQELETQKQGLEKVQADLCQFRQEMCQFRQEMRPVLLSGFFEGVLQAMGVPSTVKSSTAHPVSLKF